MIIRWLTAAASTSTTPGPSPRFRLFDVERREWSLYWANSRTGRLFPPVVGTFAGGRGDFYGDDTHDGTPIKAHYIWSDITPTSARWEQEFSVDGGLTWESNWTMDFTRA